MRDFEPFRRNLAAAIMERRLKQGLSQEDLAKKAQLHRTYISDVERGERNISVESLRRLAVALGTPVWELVKEAEEPLGDSVTDMVSVGASSTSVAME